MAWRAASLTSMGAAKSGKPCERFTALFFIARRVISRITDSVNCSAFAESIRRAMCVMLVSGMDMGIDCSRAAEFLERPAFKRRAGNANAQALRSNNSTSLGKNQVGRFWRRRMLGALITEFGQVDIREELLARPEKDW